MNFCPTNPVTSLTATRNTSTCSLVLNVTYVSCAVVRCYLIFIFDKQIALTKPLNKQQRKDIKLNRIKLQVLMPCFFNVLQEFHVV